MKKKKSGFTLIELLVVIAIIAILSTVVMAGLNSARQKGRDARRISDIKELQKALDIYQDTCEGYPNNTAGTIRTGADDDTGLTDQEADPNCPPGTTFGTYMAVLPVNITPNGIDYTYCGTDSVIPNPPVGTLTDTECTATASSLSYLVGFNIEGPSGAIINGGDVNASPGGLVGQP